MLGTALLRPSLHFTQLHLSTLHLLLFELHPTTLRFTLHPTTLRFTLHPTTLRFTLHPTTLHFTTLVYTSLALFWTSPNYTTLHNTSLHYTCRHFTSSHLNFTQLHYVSQHFTQLHFTSLHCLHLTSSSEIHPATLHNTSPNFTSPSYTSLHNTSPNFTSLHYIVYTSSHLNFTPLHFTTLHPTTLHVLSLELHPATLRFTTLSVTQTVTQGRSHTAVRNSSYLTKLDTFTSAKHSVKAREARIDTPNTCRFGPICLLLAAARQRMTAIFHSQTHTHRELLILGPSTCLLSLSLSQYGQARINKSGRQATYVFSKLQAPSRNHCWCGKARRVRYAECVSYSPCKTRAPCPALPYLTKLSHKRHGFRKKVTEHKMCVLIFCTTFVWNISHSKKNSARYY
jgi:hypothetical protein